MASSLERFISTVNKLGLAKTNLFNVEINTPRCIFDNYTGSSVSSLINLFCQTANFPPTNIGVRELRIAGPTYKRPYNIDYGGEGIALTFLVDNSMDVKGYFDLWMRNIINPNEFNAYYNEGSTTYTTDISISQVTGMDTTVIGTNPLRTLAYDLDTSYRITLQDAFPRNIGMIELDTTAQNSVHKLSVNFAYRKVIFYNKIYNSEKENNSRKMDLFFPTGEIQRDR